MLNLKRTILIYIFTFTERFTIRITHAAFIVHVIILNYNSHKFIIVLDNRIK